MKRFAWKSKVGMTCQIISATMVLEMVMDLEMTKDLEMVLLLAMSSILHHFHPFLNISKIRGICFRSIPSSLILLRRCRHCLNANKSYSSECLNVRHPCRTVLLLPLVGMSKM
jgi:hypothetical protein